ncbi:DUF4349 domain-containing protein [Amycolatopsis sp. AA4]|uniref:DUF4349 domain-containing protein n=1 Tax=Actinomycetes TaxID=1760 RepID=UPI0001DEDEC2|nr:MULTISPECIES: DUF4349 domain-containing protein [Actinomycetes]ATY09217.1 DUF4349 domain-containing protein [Amycolatopsis sp. AA4]EFL04526.1 predicted protein [Streptomyces sp. AA4]
MRTRWRCVLAGAALVLLAGCSGNSADSARSAVAPAQRQEQGAAPKQGNAQATVPEPGATDRKLARSARLELTTPKTDDVVSRAKSIATGAGGYPGQESATDDSASLTLSVPAEKLDGVLDQLSGLGQVKRREISAQDVTAQVVDVDARLATQRASVERMRALLAKAQSVSEIASVESELTSRQATLESLERQQASLAGRVAMATVSLSVTRQEAAAPAESGGFLAGLSGGWDAFVVFCTGLVRVLGVLLPFAVAFGIPAGAVFWWLRRRKARPAE